MHCAKAYLGPPVTTTIERFATIINTFKPLTVFVKLFFKSNFNLTSTISKTTCYKNPDKPTCIDLILTNCPGSFENSCVIETGFSDFHKIIVTAMKPSYRKIEPRVINYWDYKSFSSEGFRESLLENLKGNLSGNSEQSFSNFINTYNAVLDKQLP